jgi:integrase
MDASNLTKLNEAVVKGLPSPANGNKLHFFTGAVVQGSAVPRGFAVRVTKDGARSFVMDYRLGAKQRRYTIGRWPDWTAMAAVQEARKLRQRIDRGDDPLGERKEARAVAARPEPEAEKTVAEMLDEFLSTHVEKRLRRPDHYRSTFERLVKPVIGATPIYSLRRSRIASMLDGIEAENGPAMADQILAYVSSALNWFAARDEDFAPPMLKGLRRRRTKEGRDRTLTDGEICAIWQAAERAGAFGAVVRFLLLSGQRRGDVLGMEWSELDRATWTIPAHRYKTGKAHTVELSEAALAIIEAQPRTGRLVFPGRDGGAMRGISSRKQALDVLITKANGGKPLLNWTLHDLRRTARSLMARAGVRAEIAERVVGHVVGSSVARIYDRHLYADEKRAALEALARLIEQILSPAPPNVVPLRQEVAS